MLRIFAVFIVAAGLAACGGGGSSSNSASGTGASGSTGSTGGSGNTGGTGGTGSGGTGGTAGSGGTGGTGGTGGSGGSGSGGTGSGSGYVAGVYPPSSTFAAKCASPRTGTDPITHIAYPDVAGTTTDENNYLRSWTNELYLWYSEVPDIDPGSDSSTLDYFGQLKTSAKTASGAPKDRFHFTAPTSTWEQLSQAGVELSYGAIFLLAEATPPRQLVVAYVQPPSNGQPTNPALAAGVVRGQTVLSIDGVDINTTDPAGIDTLNAGLSPTTTATHTFVLQDPNATTTHTVSLAAGQIAETTVPIATKLSVGGSQVGYLLFNDQLATSEQELYNAVSQLAQLQGVSDLVLDLRYNGGGYLDIASELAYMIAGPARTGDGSSTFEQIQFNSKYPGTDPVTGASTSTLFHTTTQDFSMAAGTPLPHLDLSTVYVLTGPDTCSASEAIINGLRGVNVNVVEIGSTTCGKPYGFYPKDNCGTTYFSIEFQGVNAMGQGGYSDGFSPQNTVANAGVTIPGCAVADDFSHNLGDVNESQLAAALAYRTGGAASCPTPPSGFSPRTTVKYAFRTGPQLVARSPLKEMRILRH